MNRYRNFDLELFNHTTVDGRETVDARVMASPADAQRQQDAVTVTFPRQLRARIKKLETRGLSLEELIELGEELADLLLPPPVRDFYRRSLARLAADEGLRIRLRADTPPIAELPWEYAYVARPETPALRKGPDGFLGLDARISLVRYEITGEATEPVQRQTSVVRVAALLAEVRDPAYPPLDLMQEELNLRQALDDVGDVEAGFLRPGKLEQLEEFMGSGADVFHFAGHGDFVREMGEVPGTVEGRGRLILAGDDGQPAPLAAESLALELRGRGVQLAVLGACEAAQRDAVTPWSGVAPALVRQGIPAVVGMQYTVRDGNAVAFMRRFYRALADGQSIDSAVSDGRRAVAVRGGAAERDWGVPVVYLRSDEAVLFPEPVGPLRRNLFLALAASVMLSIWFYLHSYDFVVAAVSDWLGQAGLGLGAAAALVASWKILASTAVGTLRKRERGSAIENGLRSRYARVALSAAVAVALLLLLTTYSIYFDLDDSTTEKITLAVETESGLAFNAKPELTVERGKRLAGGPVFLQLPPRRLFLRVAEPAAMQMRQPEVRPRPWRSVRISAARDLESVRLRAVRLVPIFNLAGVLHAPGELPVKTYALRVTIGDASKAVELTRDLRQGVFYLGGPGEIVEAKVFDDETPDERREALKKCVFSDNLDEMMGFWGNAQDRSRQQIYPSSIIEEGQSLRIEIIEVIDGRLASKPIVDKTVGSEKLKLDGISTICLSKAG